MLTDFQQRVLSAMPSTWINAGWMAEKIWPSRHPTPLSKRQGRQQKMGGVLSRLHKLGYIEHQLTDTTQNLYRRHDKPKAIGRDEIIRRLKSGNWQLGSSGGPSVRFWLQSPALCCGGESVTVRYDIVRKMVDDGLLKPEKASGNQHWLTRYTLIEKEPSTPTFITCPVLAAAYPSRHWDSSKASLTHALDPKTDRLFCSKVKREHVIDDPNDTTTDPPTCPCCLSKLRKLGLLAK